MASPFPTKVIDDGDDANFNVNDRVDDACDGGVDGIVITFYRRAVAPTDTSKTDAVTNCLT